MIITWAINLSFQSSQLKWVSWTHTTPYILMTKVIERTRSMLDTPPRDKLYRRLQVFNACEHSCIMMILGGSKLSKTQYDLKAICILPMTYPKTVQYRGGGDYNIQQPRLPPNDAGRPVSQFKCPLAWLIITCKVSGFKCEETITKNRRKGGEKLTQIHGPLDW